MSDALYYLVTEITPALTGGVLGGLFVIGLTWLRNR